MVLIVRLLAAFLTLAFFLTAFFVAAFLATAFLMAAFLVAAFLTDFFLLVVFAMMRFPDEVRLNFSFYYSLISKPENLDTGLMIIVENIIKLLKLCNDSGRVLSLLIQIIIL